MYKQDHLVRFFQKEHEIKLSLCRGMFSRSTLSEPPLLLIYTSVNASSLFTFGLYNFGSYLQANVVKNPTTQRHELVANDARPYNLIERHIPVIHEFLLHTQCCKNLIATIRY